ncbi:acetyl-CoA carboxylase biotin carboxyl carrier protein [Papillibacter cinnamivorans]|uniref:Biotin carboxyl carrier protein of acetyl-CoA carboxylase n=1 Tax=Papillibacter cinnamivorans DSM 12816 TaxID=1122930 RepID=A0A1W2AHG2_9FIRM|nr:acetyl-CoA carboxylase biotin carboxyl carrier protein [Papillibacter cinnamivorans]SMC60135.1 acetyl-CoA carboxylase biotin carboxyl carrier protein [Papillibacter cinnamivorans DSM 12816]
MNVKQIRALAKILESSGLSALEVTCGQDRVRLERQNDQSASAEALSSDENRKSPESRDPVTRKDGTPGAQELKSPMVGIYYSAPSPGAEPFVSAGSKVKKGDILCVIEAMKLMNEILAETEGTISEVCAENGQLVEYGQTLFKLV